MIERLRPPATEADIRALAELLLDAIDAGAAVSFLAVLSRAQAEDWWRRTLAAPGAMVLVARDAEGIVGSVQLHPAWAPNQPHRADVAKVLVHRRARRRGIASDLMGSLEAEARAAGFRLLTLDAKRGEPAEVFLQETRLDARRNDPALCARSRRQDPARCGHFLQGAGEGEPMTILLVRLGTLRARNEGVRIGTVRRPPRGVPKSRHSSENWYDVWFPTLAPSAATVKLAQRARTHADWTRFTKNYSSEMKTPAAQSALELLALLSRQTNFSVGCYCADEARCHRSVLRELLREKGADVEP